MNRWGNLFSDIIAQFALAKKSPAALLYFLVIIIFMGGIGVWFPLLSKSDYQPESAVTYVFALLAALLTDFFINQNKEDHHSSIKNVDFRMAIIVAFIIAAVLAISSTKVSYCWSLTLMFLSMIFLWFSWWLLLDGNKFDISFEEATSATIGSPIDAHKSEEDDNKSISKSLDAFIKAKGEQKND